MSNFLTKQMKFKEITLALNTETEILILLQNVFHKNIMDLTNFIFQKVSTEKISASM